MLKTKPLGIILEKTDLEFENQAVINPGCIEKDGIVHMFYRAVRKGNFSCIGYCQLTDNKVTYRMDRALLVPEHDYERHGMEDPRVVFMDGTYYLFYTAYDGQNALVAYATSKDLVTFKKQGLLSPRIAYDKAKDYFQGLRLQDRYLLFESIFRRTMGQNVLLWEKDAFIFPKKINGKFALVHRILPGIQVIYFNDFKELTDTFWGEYLRKFSFSIIMEPEFDFENYYIGGGCPPLETPDGWLFIYHAVKGHEEDKTYQAGLALLDLNDPTKVLARLSYPLFEPTEKWELYGDVNNVVFPTSALIKDGKVYIYYGAADTVIGAKTIDLNEALTELKLHPVTKTHAS